MGPQLTLYVLLMPDQLSLVRWLQYGQIASRRASLIRQGHRQMVEGHMYAQIKSWNLSVQSYLKASQSFGVLADRASQGQVFTHISLGFLRLHQGGLALRFARQAVRIIRQQAAETGLDRPLLRLYATALHTLGLNYVYQARYRQGLKLLKQALAYRCGLEDTLGQKITLGCLGAAYAEQHQRLYAMACYEAALAIPEQVGRELEDRWCEVRLRYLLADLCRQCGHGQLAGQHLVLALTIGAPMDPIWAARLQAELITLNHQIGTSAGALRSYQIAFQ